jgi:DNA-binding NtrC family response regulator
VSTSIFGSLAHADPAKAKQRILHAIERAQGDRKKAAELLGTTHRSFYRIVDRLKFWDEIDKLVEERGFPRPAGPPRVAVKIREAVVEAEGSLRRAARALDMSEAALRERIETQDLWTEINRALKAAGHPLLARPRPAA